MGYPSKENLSYIPLQDYAKEVRMNNIKPLLIDRYNEAAMPLLTTKRNTG